MLLWRVHSGVKPLRQCPEVGPESEPQAELSKWMLENIPIDKKVLQVWLKTGYVDGSRLYPSISDTPQGGVISSILANWTLDRLEKILPSRSAWPLALVFCIDGFSNNSIFKEEKCD